MKVEESINVTFDETPLPPKTSPLEDDYLVEEQAIDVSKTKPLGNDLQDKSLENNEIINIKETKSHPLENVIEPKNINVALKDESWVIAMQEELNQFISNDVWELVPNPKDMTVIRTKWVFRNNLDENSVVSRNKDRLVAQGYNQQEGINYDETYAPLARLESIRILLAFACALDFKLFQMDVKSAFLNGFINEEVYVAKVIENQVKYTAMSDSEDSTVTYTKAPPSPDYMPGSKEPEQAPPLLDFFLEPVYPKFMPLEDEVLPAEEQPLPAAASPTADSPGYVPELDFEEDPKEDLADYPADGGDDDDDEDESSDDDEDDYVDIEEIRRRSTQLLPTLQLLLYQLLIMPHLLRRLSRYRAAMIWASVAMLRAAVPSTYILAPRSEVPPSRTPPLLPIPLPTPSPPLLPPSTDGRANARVHLLPLLELMDDEIMRDLKRDVSYGITDTWDEMLVNMLVRDRCAHARKARLIEIKARMSREAWGWSMDTSDLACTEVMKMEPKKRTTRLNPEITTTTPATTSVTNAQLQAMIDQGVTAALAACDAIRRTNGEDSHNSGMGLRRNE
ncbi:retrovirus-related pol polyprotein from transposon TNT 1-94 [Tanacetum coccineum]